jgi:hypothetical protein
MAGHREGMAPTEHRQRPGIGALVSILTLLGLLGPADIAMARRTSAEFYAQSTAHITCGVYDGHGGLAQAGCEDLGPGRVARVTLEPNGTIVTCSSPNVRTNPCDVGNVGEGTPTYGYGHAVTVGRFRCGVLRAGVRCVVLATGKGFLFGPRRTVALAGATVRLAPFHYVEFRSPDGKTLCYLGAEPASAFCNAPFYSPPRNAYVDEHGNVQVCNQPPAGEPYCSLGFPHGPTLAVGQEDEYADFRCVSATNGVTCTVVRGPGHGKGFRISSTEAVEIG